MIYCPTGLLRLRHHFLSRSLQGRSPLDGRFHWMKRPDLCYVRLLILRSQFGFKSPNRLWFYFVIIILYAYIKTELQAPVVESCPLPLETLQARAQGAETASVESFEYVKRWLMYGVLHFKTKPRFHIGHGQYRGKGALLDIADPLVKWWFSYKEHLFSRWAEHTFWRREAFAMLLEGVIAQAHISPKRWFHPIAPSRCQNLPSF